MIILHGLYDFNVSYTAASDAMHAPRLLMFSGYVLTMPASTTLGRFLGIRSRISRIWAPANNRYVGTYLNIQRFPPKIDLEETKLKLCRSTSSNVPISI